MPSFVTIAVVLIFPPFGITPCASIQTLESCAAEAPCECYESTESSADNPVGFKVATVGCSSKSFSAVPFFRKLENITFGRISLQDNRIAVVPSDAFLDLATSVIDLSGNRIDTIEDNAFRGLETTLKSLDLSANRLRTLPVPALSDLHGLEILNLRTNPEITELSSDSFKGLTSLKKLYMSNCPQGFTIHEEAFLSVQLSLRDLTIEHCYLIEVPKALQALRNLTILRLPSNHFYELRRQDFSGFISLKTLDLNNNENLTLPTSFDQTTFSQIGRTLESLDLSRIKLTSVPRIFKPLSKLKSLSLSYNNFSVIERGSFLLLAKLESLYLDGNPLDYLPGTFDGLSSSLKFVEISNQSLKRLPNAELTSLRSLRTVSASNNIFRLLEGDFTVGISATDYRLENCSITYISPSAFEGKSTQISLNLKGNFLQNLDFVRDPCYFWQIDVTDNPITCDCLTYTLSKYPHLLIKGTCAAPEDVEDLVIGSADFDQVMYWKCVDHFFEDTKLCSKWWINISSTNRHTPLTVACGIVAVLLCLYL